MTKNKQKQDTPHKTISGYCCACEYDIAVIEKLLKIMTKNKKKFNGSLLGSKKCGGDCIGLLIECSEHNPRIK